MIPGLRLLVSLILLTIAQPVFAHGPEQHEKDQAMPAAATANANVSHEVSPAVGAKKEQGHATRSADHHEAQSASIWTRLHPATVHFPIALLLMAALTELLSVFNPAPGLRSAVRVMAVGGAVGAVVAALFGWIHTGLWLGGDATMQWHRWTGTGLAIAAPLPALLSYRADRLPFRGLLFLIAIVLLAQGYWGGELAHGSNHLGL